MNEVALADNEVLLVASRGLEKQHGLWLWQNQTQGWRGRQIGTVRQLSSLTGHPALPVVYGTSGMGQGGELHAWRIDRQGEVKLSEASSQGAEPCDLVADPSGRLLIATNYTSSTLALQRLDASGGFSGELSLLRLRGGGPELPRQDDAHPHQAFFLGDVLVVIDLGADLVREFKLNLDDEAGELLTEIRTTAVPPGTGPRHGVVLPDGRLAISGELGENLVTGRLGDPVETWANVRSTRIRQAGRTRWERNYPGDIRRSPDGRHVYFANRSHNTLATFDVTKRVPELVMELDATVDWPQHILVRPGYLLVAGWDSSRVVVMPVADGVPESVVPLFECEGAGWLHAHRVG